MTPDGRSLTTSLNRKSTSLGCAFVAPESGTIMTISGGAWSSGPPGGAPADAQPPTNSSAINAAQRPLPLMSWSRRLHLLQNARSFATTCAGTPDVPRCSGVRRATRSVSPTQRPRREAARPLSTSISLASGTMTSVPPVTHAAARRCRTAGRREFADRAGVVLEFRDVPCAMPIPRSAFRAARCCRRGSGGPRAQPLE